MTAFDQPSRGGRNVARTVTPTGYAHDHDDARDRAADTTDRFPDDQLCRRQGFRILGRPDGHPAVWGRNGKEFLHDEAVAIARIEERRAKARRDEVARDATGGG
jgi:hypothetical protein